MHKLDVLVADHIERRLLRGRTDQRQRSASRLGITVFTIGVVASSTEQQAASLRRTA